MHRDLQGIRVLLTGASSGIGLATALQLADAGARLLVTARREAMLRELRERLQCQGRQIDYLAGDITDPAHRSRLLDWVESHWSALDVLINNAGVGALGPFVRSDPQRLQQIMRVNFFAPVELTRLVLPLLKQGTRPAIVNVGSVLGHRAVPNKSEYCASKFALHGWSESLRLELAPEIDVILISPSTTASEFFEVLLATDGPDSRLSRHGMSTRAVATAVVGALRRGRREVILTAGGKALVWLNRLCPALADRVIRRGMPRQDSR